MNDKIQLLLASWAKLMKLMELMVALKDRTLNYPTTTRMIFSYGLKGANLKRNCIQGMP
jgi:hypothetical protein